MTPEQFAILRDLIRQATEGAIPYPWVAAVVGFLVLALGIVGRLYLGAVKDARDTMTAYLDFAKTATPILEAAKERLKERSRGLD